MKKKLKSLFAMTFAFFVTILLLANVSSATTVPYPWLDFSGNFSRDTTNTYSSDIAVTTFATYNDGTASLSDPVSFTSMDLTIGSGGGTLTISGWMTADVIITNPSSFDDFDSFGDSYVAMLDNVVWLTTSTSRWKDEFSYAISTSTSPYDGQLRLAHLGIGSGGTHNIAGKIAPVPEPGTMILLGSGLVGLAFYGRRRKKA